MLHELAQSISAWLYLCMIIHPSEHMGPAFGRSPPVMLEALSKTDRLRNPACSDRASRLGYDNSNTRNPRLAGCLASRGFHFQERSPREDRKPQPGTTVILLELPPSFLTRLAHRRRDGRIRFPTTFWGRSQCG